MGLYCVIVFFLYLFWLCSIRGRERLQITKLYICYPYNIRKQLNAGVMGALAMPAFCQRMRMS